MKIDPKVRWLFALIMLFFMRTGLQSSEASVAYQEAAWSEPSLLTLNARDPIAVADSAGDLHVFFVGRTDDGDKQTAQTIYYMSRLGGQWRPPLDILISAISEAHLLGAAVDEMGILHVGWHDDEAAYHSRSHISLAGNARQWETEVVLARRFPSGEMVLDQSGRLHMALAVDFVEVVYLYSDDGGERWTAPLPVYREFEADELAIGGAQLAVDMLGVVHVTWYETAREVDWNLWSVWYGRSSDEGNSWQVSEMVTPLFGESDVAVDGDGNVHLVYGRNISYGDGRWHQWSSDGGETWSTARRLFPGVEYASGSTGGWSFAMDGDERLHLVNTYGNRAGDASAWHLVWLGNRWSEPENLMDVRYHAHSPSLAIANGNELNFFATSARMADGGLFESHLTSDSRHIETRPVPTPVPGVIADAAENEVSAVEPTPRAPRVELSEEVRQAPPVEAPFDALLISVGAAALMILLSLLVVRRSPGRRR